VEVRVDQQYPLFVFAGKRMMPELMKNASPGATCAMSETGWSNSEIFRKYLKGHFFKFIPRREPNWIQQLQMYILPFELQEHVVLRLLIQAIF
jgi:hypothetical protein